MKFFLVIKIEFEYIICYNSIKVGDSVIMEKYIKIVNSDKEVNYKFITAFKIEDKSFIVLNTNTKDADNNIKTNISKIDNDKLTNVNDEEWNLIKKVITSIVKGDSDDYKYIEVSESYNIEDFGNYCKVLGLKEDKVNEISDKYEVKEDTINIPIINGMETQVTNEIENTVADEETSIEDDTEEQPVNESTVDISNVEELDIEDEVDEKIEDNKEVESTVDVSNVENLDIDDEADKSDIESNPLIEDVVVEQQETISNTEEKNNLIVDAPQG